MAAARPPSAGLSLRSEESERPSLAARLGPRLFISLLLGALFAWIAQRGGVPLLPPAHSFAGVRWAGVALAAALLLALTVLRATRWRFLIAPIKSMPLRDVVLLNWVGFFAIFALPLRLGELARPTLGKLKAQIPLSAGLGTVAVERVIDGALTSGCMAWVLWALPRQTGGATVARLVPAYASLVLGVFVAALLALFAFLWKRALAVRLTEWGVGLISPRLGRLLAAKVDSVADGVRSIGSPRLALGFVAESLAYWGLNACFMWTLGLACGLPMQLSHAVAVMSVLALGILLPGGPGLFGTFQLAVGAALGLYFEPALVSGPGAAFSFLLYALNALMMVAVGTLALWRLHVPLALLVAPKMSDTRPPGQG